MNCNYLDLWKKKTILLDMDGVLIDLAFANFFWQEFLPSQYALQRMIPVQAAARELEQHFMRVHGTLDWYSTDYWHKLLDLDIIALKNSLANRIQLRPGAIDFLNCLKAVKKRCILVSNAHPDSIAIKLGKTGIAHYFDVICSSHQLGLAKENPGFWQQFCSHFGVDPDQCAFIDDNEAVLNNAGIDLNCLYTVYEPDSRKKQPKKSSYSDVGDFSCFLSSAPQQDRLDSLSRDMPQQGNLV